MKFLALGLLLLSTSFAQADQFTLFDETFTFTAEEAVPTKSHLYVQEPEQMKHWPIDWTSPVDYRNGTVHVRIEVLEKPDEETPTTWSLCYSANEGTYGCTNTPMYSKKGVYEKSAKMNEFWHNDLIDWTKGVKKMSLVIKGEGGGKAHAHNKPDPSKYFPTKVRVTMVQVSAGAEYDPELVGEEAKD